MIGLKSSAGRTLASTREALAPPPLPPTPAWAPHRAPRPRRRLASRSAVKASSTSDAAAAAAPAAYQPPHFSDLPLDRAGSLRKQQEQLQQLLEAPTSRAILLHQSKLLVGPAGDPRGGGSSSGSSSSSSSSGAEALALHPHSFAAPGTAAPEGGPPRWLPLLAATQLLLQLQASSGGPAAQEQMELLFLGLDAAGHAVFAAQAPPHLLSLLPPLPPPRGSTSSSGSSTAASAAAPADASAAGAAAGAAAAEAGPFGEWVDVRKEGHRMTGPDSAVAALAAGLVQWHATAAFCGRTGEPTRVRSGGHSRAPEATPTSGSSSSSSRRPRPVYPRIDPAVIVAVSCGDWLLLGRKAAWAPARYSCLAGFAEVGETLEQAVGREVMEESGIAVDLSSVRYHSSQPWPFPQSLMIGFIAEAATPAAAGATAVEATGAAGAAAAAGSAQPGSTPPALRPQPPPRGLGLLQGQALSAALDVGLRAEEAERYMLPQLPPVEVDTAELEDVRWLHADFLAAATGGGGMPALVRGGGGPGPEFRIPGKYALASRIICTWLQERQQQQQQGGHDPGEAAVALAAVPDVCIDEGSFKYVLLRLSTPDGQHSKLLVRGDSRAAYHNHVLQAAAAELRAVGPTARLQLETLGGGRMEHYGEQRAISLYGFSAAFGQAPHDVTAQLLRRWLPLHQVSTSYSGY